MTHQRAAGLNDITSRIIAAAIRIHQALGPGLLENAYMSCLAYELTVAGLRFELQKAVPVVYNGVKLDCAYRADIVVEGAVLVEVKALETVPGAGGRRAFSRSQRLGQRGDR